MINSKLTYIGNKLDRIKDYVISNKIGDIHALNRIIGIFEDLIDSNITQDQENVIYNELYNIIMVYISRQQDKSSF
jgi:hypothetical protein